MDEEQSEVTFTVLGNWRWIAAFALTVAPLINPQTGNIEQQIGNDVTQVYRYIPAEGSSILYESYRAGVLKRGDDHLGYLGNVLFSQQGDATLISIVQRAGSEAFWFTLTAQIELFSSAFGKVHRESIGHQFEYILDRYYEDKSRGLKPKLTVMAREANVNYGSLRQAKIRYDQKRYGKDVIDN
jgi:hypothetical protein